MPWSSRNNRPTSHLLAGPPSRPCRFHVLYTFRMSKIRLFTQSDKSVQRESVPMLSRISLFLIAPHSAVLLGRIISGCSASIRHGKGSTIEHELCDIGESQTIDGLFEWTIGKPFASRVSCMVCASCIRRDSCPPVLECV
jgi:hypothetical protein